VTPLVIRLQPVRERARLSQAALARASGVAQATISRIEAGKTAGIDLRTLERLANALGVEPAALLARTGRRR
jgi:transcriptional regulator with XRE-family HTH domain